MQWRRYSGCGVTESIHGSKQEYAGLQKHSEKSTSSNSRPMIARQLALLVSTILIATSLAAQVAAPPTPVTPVFPITGYVDRFLDSSGTRDWQQPLRTL